MRSKCSEVWQYGIDGQQHLKVDKFSMTFE